MYEIEEKTQNHGITCKIPWVVPPPSSQKVKGSAYKAGDDCDGFLWILLLGGGTTQIIPLNYQLVFVHQ